MTPRIFISSSFADLSENRRVIADAILREGARPSWDTTASLGVRAVGEQWRAIEAQIQRSDLVVMAVDRRQPPRVSSFLEHECRIASERQIPILAFELPEHGNREGDTVPLYVEELYRSSARAIHRYDSSADLEAQLIRAIRLVIERRTPAPIRPVIAADENVEARPSTHLFVGRDAELTSLRQAWEDRKGTLSASRERIRGLVVVTGEGGVGKSFLVARYLETHPERPRAFWWNFQTDRSVGRFLDRALDYFSALAARPSANRLALSARADLLIETLRTSGSVLVLDGIESLMRAYSTPDLPGSLTGRSNDLRQLNSLEMGRFLARTATLERPQVIVTTRVLPTIPDEDGRTNREPSALHLMGLKPHETRTLIREYGVDGPERVIDELADLAKGNPLVVRLLAGQMLYEEPRSPLSPDGFTTAKVADRFRSLAEHLAPESVELLRTLATLGVRMRFDSIAKMVLRSGGAFWRASLLDRGLLDLEERGLLWWDREDNSYTLPPTVAMTVRSLKDPDNTE